MSLKYLPSTTHVSAATAAYNSHSDNSHTHTHDTQTDSGREREHEREKRTDERWKTTVWWHRMRRRKMANAICNWCKLAILGSCMVWLCVRVDKRPYLTSCEYIISACKLILSNLIKTISNYGLLMHASTEFTSSISSTLLHIMWHKRYAMGYAKNLQQQLGESEQTYFDNIHFHLCTHTQIARH